MKSLFALLTFSFWVASSHAEELTMFGALPELPRGWLLCEKSSFGKPSWQWSWVIVTNSQNGDLLSFAAHKGTSEKPRDLINWSDTANEILPGGFPVWTTQKAFGKWPIRNGVVRLDRFRDALEYSFIEEDRTNRLAHGYAIDFGDVVLFVQHTSARVITSDLARQMASSLSRIYMKTNAVPANPAVGRGR